MSKRPGNSRVLPPYEDHIRLWADELRAWVPDAMFDSHVHIGPPQAVGPIAPERRSRALTTFMSLSWEELLDTHAALYSGKTICGLVAVPFPQREVNGDTANDYIIETMKRDARVQGFLVSEPTDARSAVAAFERALRAGVRFSGVKPYADRLGKSNFKATMAEFLPDDLLEFMDRERLVMLLHTSGLGVVTDDVQNFLRRMADRYPHIRVLLAHMGRYVNDQQFLSFMDTDVLATCPTLYLEMSSASCPEVYDRVLRCEWLHSRLLFGSDLPFGMISGVEQWSDTHGAIFLTRDTYPWSDPAMNAEFAQQRQRLTYNTYHCIQALKEALARQGYEPARAEQLKMDVFCGNALRLFGCDPVGNTNGRT
ncbi:MAG: amidohydrolase family protein [Victivallales bacterium]|nr:amidohydrolase family protein [Victivallales bacterium]